MSIPIAQFSTPSSLPHRSFSPLVSLRLFSTSVSQLLPCKPVHLYHFSRSHIHALIYDICFSLSDLLHSVWQSLDPSTSQQMTQFRSFLWLRLNSWPSFSHCVFLKVPKSFSHGFLRFLYGSLLTKVTWGKLVTASAVSSPWKPCLPVSLEGGGHQSQVALSTPEPAGCCCASAMKGENIPLPSSGKNWGP